MQKTTQRTLHIFFENPNYISDLEGETNTSGEEPWAPFKDKDEWELAQFLVTEVSQTVTNKFLKLPITKNRMQPSYSSNYTLLKKIDSLPTKPKWNFEIIEVRAM
ncbi:hypothetical protein BJV77DRAFT_955350 [Russula vinacea]|nr:hypothetical protein BJV77DRAFT_955350 [Russula vinacea]